MKMQKPLDNRHSGLADAKIDAPRIPVWGISLVCHLILLLCLGLFIRFSAMPVRGALGVRTADNVGIVLKSDSPSGVSQYMNQSDLRKAEFERNDRTAAGGANDPLLSAQTLSELRSEQLLPNRNTAIGAGTVSDLRNVGNVANLGSDAHGQGNISDGKGAVSMFGDRLNAKGNKFAFVFDRSSSMDGKPLRAAKAELNRAIDSLEPQYRFSVVFFNNDPLVFMPGTGTPYANEENKNDSKQFVASVTATGGTDHYKALVAACDQKPDAIIFLTDGDKPELTSTQLQQISRRADGAQINVVQFGGSQTGPGENFLRKLARDNGGAYLYVAVSSL